MAIENVQEFKNFIEANKDNTDVKDFLNGFSTLDVFKGKVTSNKDFMSFMDSEKDKYSSKALETWKSNNLQKLIDEKVKELYPEADPKDVELQKMKQEIENMKRDSLAKELKLQTNSLFADKKFDIRLSEFVGGENIEQVGERAEKLNTYIQEIVAAQVSEKLKSGYKPPSGGDGNVAITKEKFEEMGYLERVKLANENPDLYSKLNE